MRLLLLLIPFLAVADNPFLYRYEADGLRITLVDHLRDTKYSWPRSLLSYPVDFADFAGDEEDLRLFAADGTLLPFQLTDQRYGPQRRLRFAILNLVSDLPTGGRREFRLVSRPDSPLADESGIAVHQLPDASLIIDTGALRIRIPNSKHAEVIPPLMQLERDDGWLGSARYRSDARPSHLGVERLIDGPLIAEFAVTVSFSDGGVHHSRLRAVRGFDHFEIHETIAGFAESPDARWEFRWVGGPPGSMRPTTLGPSRACWQLTQEKPTDTVAIFAIKPGLPVRIGDIRGTLAFAFPLKNGQRSSAIAFGPPQPHCWHQQHFGDLPLNQYKDWRLAARDPAHTFELFHAYRATAKPRIDVKIMPGIASIATALPNHPMSREWLDRLRVAPNAPIDFRDRWPSWAVASAAQRYLGALSAPIDGVRQRPLPAPPLDQLARVDPILAEQLAYIDDPDSGTRPPLRSAIIPGHGLVLRGAPATRREVSVFVPESDGDAMLVRPSGPKTLPIVGRASLVADLGELHYGRVGDHHLLLVDSDYLDLGQRRFYTSDAAPRSHDRRSGSGIVRDFFDGRSELAVFGGGVIQAHGIDFSTSPGLSASLHTTRPYVAGGQFFARRNARAVFEAAPGADLSGLRFSVDGRVLPLQIANSAASIGLPRGQHSWQLGFADSAESFALKVSPPPGTPPRLHELIVRAENTWLGEDDHIVLAPGPVHGECVSESGGTLHLRFSPPPNVPAPPLTLAAHWPMDSGAGDVVADIVGDAKAVLVGIDGQAWRKQKGDGFALAFNGEGQQLLSNLKVSLLEDCSLGLWFKSQVSGALVAREIGIDSGIGMALRSNGAVTARVMGTELRSPLGYNDNQWHHVVLTLRYMDDRCQVRLYIDGAVVDLQEAQKVEGDDREDPLRFGCAPPFGSDQAPPRCYFGLLDDVRIYLGALEPDVIAAWTQSGSGFSPPTLLLPKTDYAPPGKAYRRELRALATPVASISVTGLPVWLHFDPLTGALEGTPPAIAAGTDHELRIKATNSEGEDQARLLVRVPSPVVVPSNLRVYVDGREAGGRSDDKGLSIAVPPGRHRWELTHRQPRLRTPQIQGVSNHAGFSIVHIQPIPGVRQWLTEISRDAGETWSVHQRVESTRFRVEGVSGTRIWVRASAMRGRDLSEPSALFPVAFSDQAPNPPGHLEIQLNPGIALLRWSQVLGAANYRLLRRRPGAEWEEVYSGSHREFADSATGLMAPFDPPGLRAAAVRDMSQVVRYEYVVVAENGNGQSAHSATVVADPSRWH